MKKEILNQWLGVLLVAVLVFVNAPRVFGAFVLTGSHIDDAVLSTSSYYGYNTASGVYGYGYGYGFNYWDALSSALQEVEPYSGYATDPNSTAVSVSSGSNTIGGGIAGGTTVTGPASGTATIDFTSMETGSFSPSSGPLTGNTYDYQVDLGNSSDTVTFQDGANSTVSLIFAAGTTLYSDTTTDFSAFQVPTFGAVSTTETTVGTSTIDISNVVTIGGTTGSTHIVVDPAATIYYPYTSTAPVNIGYRASNTDAWTLIPACDNPTSISSTQNICFYNDASNTRLVIKTRYLSQFAGTTGTTGGGTTGGGGGGGGPTAICGNSRVEGTEQCDDGNKASGDGCSATCMLEGDSSTKTIKATVIITPDGERLVIPVGTAVRKTRFPDSPRGTWYYSYVEVLRKAGIVHGTVAGNFEPGRDLTRVELVKIALNTFNIETPTSVSENPFDDVSKNHWGAPYIQKAKSLGILSGYADGTFRPDSQINRVEALKILLLASDLDIKGGSMNFPDTVSGAWYERYVALAQSLGIVNGYPDGTFGPGNSIKRSEMAKIAVETLEETLE